VHAGQVVGLCIEHYGEFVVELSNVDFTFGLRRPLAAEIDKRPLLTFQIMPLTNERHAVDSKHILNTNKKPFRQIDW
jgi:hypothetical protein